MRYTILVWIPRSGFLNILEHRFEAQFDGIDVPEEVAVLSFVHLFDSNDTYVRLVLLEALKEWFSENEVISSSAAGKRRNQPTTQMCLSLR